MLQSVRKFQDQLIARAQETYSKNRISERVIRAFYETPRHLFVPKYRLWENREWSKVTDDNLEVHLSTLYADQPLILHGADADFEPRNGSQPVSTISQPSFVLRLLDLLQLEEGQKVFELGAGSGWNAALMGQLVGKRGKVVSLEIIPELIQSARESAKKLGLDHVHIYPGDGGDGYEREAPFDRAIFTAGAFDLPKSFYRQLREGALFLFVMKNKGGADNIFVLKKAGDCFESIFSMPCGFVPVTGKYHIEDMEALPLSRLLHDRQINPSPVERMPFWWGSNSPDSFFWATAGVRSFFSVTEAGYQAIELEKGGVSFGLLDGERKSLVVASHDGLVSYGTTDAREILIEKMKRWIDLGMPSLSNLKMKVFPVGRAVELTGAQWLVRRRESVFVFELPARD